MRVKNRLKSQVRKAMLAEAKRHPEFPRTEWFLGVEVGAAQIEFVAGFIDPKASSVEVDDGAPAVVESNRYPVAPVRRSIDPTQEDLLVGEALSRDVGLVLNEAQVPADLQVQASENPERQKGSERDIPSLKGFRPSRRGYAGERESAALGKIKEVLRLAFEEGWDQRAIG